MIINQCVKFFHYSAKLITDDSGTEKVFRSTVMTSIINFVSENWIAKIVDHRA